MRAPNSPDLSPGSEETAVPEPVRRWAIEGEAWVEKQRAKGRYKGRNGDEAVRFLAKCGRHLDAAGKLVPPRQVEEEHLYALMPITGRAPSSHRYYFALLGSFLMSLGNPVVRTTQFLRRFPKKTGQLRRLTRDERDRMFAKAVGTERVVLALMTVGLRRVEVYRMRVVDVDLHSGFIWVRGKGYNDEPSRQVPLTETIRKELAWYLPLRGQWASAATEDTGHLLCWMNGSRLTGYSYQSIDRLVISAGQRIGKRVTSHDLRRTMATLLQEAKADPWEIQTMLGHTDLKTTQIYLASLEGTPRIQKVAALLEVGA